MKIHFICVVLLFAFITAQAQTHFPKIGGWQLSKEIKKYDKESLWEPINGAAEYYLKFGFDTLEVAEYIKSEDQYIKAEVYRHSTPLNAFGIYAYERSGSAEFIDIGTQGYLSHSSLNFLLGHYYVKVHSHQSDEKTINAIKKVAEKIAANLGDIKELPEELSFFPEFEKVFNTEKYYPANYLGYSYFNQVLTSDYTFEDKEYELFVILPVKHENIDSVFSEIISKAGLEKKPENNEIIGYEDLFNGYIALVRTGEYILGIQGINNRDVANDYLRQFTEYLVASDK